MWLYKFWLNRMLKICIIVAYTARDPCATSHHTIHNVHNVYVHVQMYILPLSVSLFRAVIESECSSVPVEVLSSELWVSSGIFRLIPHYLLLHRQVIGSKLSWKRTLLLQQWLATWAMAMAGKENATPPSLTKTVQQLGGMLQRTATCTVLAKMHKFNRIMHKPHNFNDAYLSIPTVVPALSYASFIIHGMFLVFGYFWSF